MDDLHRVKLARRVALDDFLVINATVRRITDVRYVVSDHVGGAFDDHLYAAVR